MKFMNLALASASALAMSCLVTTTAAAQTTGAVATASEDATLGEIVVTARRRTESLQEVPQVVNAVSGENLQKLSIKQFRDLQNVVPGLNMKVSNAGTSSDIELRGVSFASTTSAQPTVALYMNDVTIQSNFLFNSMYDIGQIEILRGPQGTQRGVAAPSGAITVTTRKPDLSEYGGYIDFTATDLQARNVNAAVNIPIIRDVLGVRVAGVFDQNPGTAIRSIYSRLRPNITNSSVRVSVSFEPSDAFNANLMYQHNDRVIEQFIPVTGAGFAGNAARGLVATPAIGMKDTAGVADEPMRNRQHQDVVTLQLDSRVFGQHLSYVGGYSYQTYQSREDRDVGNNLVGVPFVAATTLHKEDTSHEIRLSSDPSPDRFFDYVVGAYYGWEGVSDDSFNTFAASFLPTAFGPPATPNLAAFNPLFQVPLIIPTPSGRQDTSIFGSVTLHLGEKTELTGGLRHLWVQSSSDLLIRTGNGVTASPVCPPPALLPGPQPGTCTVPSAAIQTRPPQRLFHEEHTIYNVSLKHRFTRDLMAYGSVATSYRQPYASIGIINNGNPVLSGLQIHPSEKSRAFEVGVKWTFMEGRGRLNAALFRQKFQDMPVQTSAVPYIANSGVAAPTVQNFAFVADPDAIVEGFDIDAAFQITPNWSISGQLSYADGRATTDIPCNDSNFDGTPDAGQVTSVSQFPAGVVVALCPGGSVAQTPYWNATFQTEYLHQVTDDVDAYLRGLLTVYPKNARATPAMVIDDYSLLNLYAGLKAKDGAWEAGLFVRNAFKTEKVTNLNVNQSNNFNSTLTGAYASLIHNSGYFEKALTPRREVGINVRYAFGSR